MNTHTQPRALGRRRFLQVAGATAAMSAVQASPARAFFNNLGYVDAHSHIWSPDRTYYPLRPQQKEENVKPTGFTLGEFFSHARPEGVNRVVVVGHTGHYGTDASYLIDLLKSRPGEVAIQAYIDHKDPNVVSRMEELADQGVKAFRIVIWDPWKEWWTADDPIVKAWQYARERKLVICPLTNPDWLPQLDVMMEDYPGTTLVIDHFARIGVDNFGTDKPGTLKPADIQALAKIARHPEAYVKVSAFYALGRRTKPYDDMLPMIHEMVRAYGPERLMWGSDCPYQLTGGHTYAASIAVVRDRLTDVTVEDREWMLRKTAERVFFT